MFADSEIASANLFMMCSKLKTSALAGVPDGYHIRFCRPEEIDIWKAMHFDDPSTAESFRPFMDEFFQRVYWPEGDRFWKVCRFICNSDDIPVGTCLAWKAYGRIMTIQWYKILKAYEGRGLGRALLSSVMRSVNTNEFPVYLHTHPACSRAIKLYTDFGFLLLSGDSVGNRSNDLKASMPFLRETLSDSAYRKLKFAPAPEALLSAAATTEMDEF